MYVCICNAVTEKAISEEINNGITDVKTLIHKFDVQNGCAKCARELKEMIDKILNYQNVTDILQAQQTTVINNDYSLAYAAA